ncbi:MAG: ABC transporter ATP-binding protein [Oceanipulchritudo sp.]
MKAIVRCQNLHKIYHQGEIEVHALRGVDLNVENGEFTALAGPSGSGKTTLLNLIGGLDRFDEGDVTINDYKLSGLGNREKTELRLRHIGFIFQAYNLIPVLSALENVEYIMLLQGVSGKERGQRARSILDEVGLGEMIDRRPHEMSGGQQQRVAVARALVTEPDIILADEPTANLDSQTARSLLHIMQKMNERHGVTFVFSTHDTRVMECARRIVTLRDGKVHKDEQKG